uniref:non-specific serine/threonine protein kinase n=1 Tax=Kalanchoe fedtschenkoi TaxID=63787 RepID=A0A7N0TQU9_KALFE
MRRCLVQFLCLVVIILGLCQFTDDFSRPELLSLPSVDAKDNELASSSSLGKFDSLQPSPVISNELGLEDSDRLDRGKIQSLTRTPSLVLISALNGTVLLVESKSQIPLWSFSSGPSIYSSYQAPIDQYDESISANRRKYFIDIGEDWELSAYFWSNKQRKKLSLTVDELVSLTPKILDGVVIVGSKKSTVFLLDAKSGRLINSYQSSMSDEEDKNVLYEGSKAILGSGSADEKNDETILYITRNDYLLQGFDPISNKLLWKLAIGQIDAFFTCNDKEDPGWPLEYFVGSMPGGHLDMPSSCRAVVYRPPLIIENEEFIRGESLKDSGLHRMILDSNTEFDQKIPSQALLPQRHDRSLDYSNLNGVSNLFTFGNRQPLPLNGDVDRSEDEAFLHEEIQTIHTPKDNDFHTNFVAMSILCIIIVIVVIGLYRGYRSKEEVQPDMMSTVFDAKVSVKKKKVKKSGKNSSVAEKSEEEYSNSQSQAMTFNFTKLTDNGNCGRRVGKLFITSKEIGKGSNGTIVFEGMYEGRPVAVKRLVQAHQDAAFKEIQNLIASDRHPNIVRWYGVEYDNDFVYLSLERCTCSLDDLIQIFSDCTPNSLISGEQSSKTFTEHKMWLDSVKCGMQDFNMWNANTYPSPSLLQLLRDVVAGLAHLHDLGIVHRDLKPQNVLIIKERSLRAKLSDMGISKQLVGDMSALDNHATGCGSSGWQAPEQLLQGRQTRAVDVFSLGCVLFFCVTGGRHPFGDRLERDINIVKNKADLFSVDHIPEAVDLFLQLLNPNPILRSEDEFIFLNLYSGGYIITHSLAVFALPCIFSVS